MGDAELLAELDGTLLSLDFLLAILPGTSDAEHIVVERKIRELLGNVEAILYALDTYAGSCRRSSPKQVIDVTP